MTATALRRARQAKDWSQVDAAARLGVSQPYLAMLERGQRRLTPKLALRLAKVYGLEAATVPPSRRERPRRVGPATLAKDLAGLGYPGFAHLRPRRWTPKNPGEVLLSALAQDDVEPRLVEALPWVVVRYATVDWTGVVRDAKLHDLQNRLGFVVSLARQLAEKLGDKRKTRSLGDLEARIERSRLAREDTLCGASLSDGERRWLSEHRSEAARHWNLLTDWTVDALRYTA